MQDKDSLRSLKWGFLGKEYALRSARVWGPKGQSFHVRLEAEPVSSRACWGAVGIWRATQLWDSPQPSLRSSSVGQVPPLPQFDGDIITNDSLSSMGYPMISVRMGNPGCVDVTNPHNLVNVLFVSFMDAHSEKERSTGVGAGDCVDMLNQGPVIVVWGTNKDQEGFFFARPADMAPPFNTSGETLSIDKERAALHQKYVIGLITLALTINPNPILNHNPNPNPYPVAKLRYKGTKTYSLSLILQQVRQVHASPLPGVRSKVLPQLA
jgi:hypothetical protein